ncbi:MAG: hypothetical protein KGN80_06030 [Acidobacteriota bacterium]|nr:hypothetical protein [Acidobacteriota bacterium]
MLLVFALSWNAILHLVFLAKVNASVRHLHRADLPDKMWLSVLLAAGIVVLFVLGHQRFVHSPSVREGALFGLYFALVAGLLVDLNQYVLYPIPAGVAALWFAGGLAEFVLYGVFTSQLLSRSTPGTPPV